MNFLTKLTFLIEKPPAIIVTGKGRKTTTEAINKVLKPKFKHILIKQVEAEKVGEFSFFIRHSKKPVLVVTNIGEIPPKEEFFTGERGETIQIRKLARNFPLTGNLVLNFDDETVREIEDEAQVPCLTFGFQEGADFVATDIKENTGTNFKINYEGNIVPVWLENLFGKEQAYSALAAAACGVVLGLNLVDISQSLK